MWIFRFLYREDKTWLESIFIVHEYVDFFIHKVIENHLTQDTKGSLEEPERYVLLHEMAKQIQDKADLRSHILTVFMPGKSTLAVLAGNLFHVLARTSDVWKKFRVEVLSLDLEPSEIIFEVLKSMKYLQAVINESKYHKPTEDNSFANRFNYSTSGIPCHDICAPRMLNRFNPPDGWWPRRQTADHGQKGWSSPSRYLQLRPRQTSMGSRRRWVSARALGESEACMNIDTL